MSAKVSVIIPVYNVERYIEECLNSLIHQTLSEIEIICVDDGSTDGTMELLRKYEAADTRVKVIQQQNQYAGVARNNGMQYATGEYMIFLDSDDFFEESMLEKTYNEAKRTDADVVLFGGQIFDDVTKEVKAAPWYLKTQILPENLPFSAKDTDGQLLNAISPAPWTKLFKSEFVRRNNIQFQPFQNSNDAYFIFVSVCTAERISYVDEPFVNYRKGMTSNIQSRKSKAPLCFLDAYYSAYKTLVERGTYEYVKKGFRSAVISGCLYNYDSYRNQEVKDILLEAFMTEKFTEMDLFGGTEEEYSSYKMYKRLKLLVETYAWKKDLKQGLVEYANDEKQPPELSIIMPVNNAEENIENCLESILNQSFRELEVICVDENSKDSTLDIIYRLKTEDERIKVYWQEEENQGTARSCGMQHARGKYVLFLEAENVLAKKALEKAYMEAEKKEAEIVCMAGKTFASEIVDAKQLPKCVQKKGFIKKRTFNANNDEFLLSRHSMELWTKIFRRDFLEHEKLVCPECLHETRILGTLALSVAEKLLIVDKAEVYFKERKKDIKITEEDVIKEFQLLYGIYDELNARGIYQRIEEGFKEFVAFETVRMFNKITKYSVKDLFVKELFSEDFARLQIFEEEEQEQEVADKKKSTQYYCLQGLRKGYLWKQRMEELQQRKEYEVVVPKRYELKPKVSVIVPCYNIEEYVGECLESLIDQTLKEIEIICVNDGSTDGTQNILLEYAKRDSRIIVVEQENSGLSVGRNVGVKNASGEYICFVDSDDLLELFALEELYEEAKKKDLDILFYDGDSFFETDDMREKKSNYVDYYVRLCDYSEYRNGTELMCAMYENSEYRQSACMQMINREYFLENELWFHPGILHEDNPFTFKGLLHSEHVAHVNKVYYLRRVKENSIMTSRKTFSHSYGYFASFLDMWDIAKQLDFSGEQNDVISRMLLQVINNARSAFRAMDNDEKYMFECLDPRERQLYFSLIVNVERQLNSVKNLKKQKLVCNEKIDTLKKQLKDTNTENVKLKKELGKIKRSRAYKLALLFRKPMAWLKKIYKKFR